MGRDAEVTMYLDHVKVLVDQATAKVLAAVAFQIEGEAKVRARVDTGFMRNSLYVISRGAEGDYEKTPESGSYYSKKQKIDVARAKAPAASLPADADAAVVAGAEYSIYIEQRHPFLFPAAALVAGLAGGTAERVYRDRVKD